MSSSGLTGAPCQCRWAIESLSFPLSSTGSGATAEISGASPEKVELFQRLRELFTRAQTEPNTSSGPLQMSDLRRVFYDFEETKEEYDSQRGDGVRLRYAVPTDVLSGELNAVHEAGTCKKRKAIVYKTHSVQGKFYVTMPLICSLFFERKWEMKKVALSLNIKTNIPAPFEPMTDGEKECFKNCLVITLVAIRGFAASEKSCTPGCLALPVTCSVVLPCTSRATSVRYFTTIPPRDKTETYTSTRLSYPLTADGWTEETAKQWEGVSCIGRELESDFVCKQRAIHQFREICLQVGRKKSASSLLEAQEGRALLPQVKRSIGDFLESELMYGTRVFDELVSLMQQIFYYQKKGPVYDLASGPFWHYFEQSQRLELFEKYLLYQTQKIQLTEEETLDLRRQISSYTLQIHQEKIGKLTGGVFSYYDCPSYALLELVASESSSRTALRARSHCLEGVEQTKKQIALIKQERDCALLEAQDLLDVLQKKFDEVQNSLNICHGIELMYGQELATLPSLPDRKAQFSKRLSVCPMRVMEDAIRRLIARLPKASLPWVSAQESSYLSSI